MKELDPKALEKAARSDAECDGRPFDGLSRADKQRYIERAAKSQAAYLAEREAKGVVEVRSDLLTRSQKRWRANQQKDDLARCSAGAMTMADIVEMLRSYTKGVPGTLADLREEAADEITRLRERCEGYKGQVEYGASEIKRLEAERDALSRMAGEPRIVVRWETAKNENYETAWVGGLKVGEIGKRDNYPWWAYVLRTDNRVRLAPIGDVGTKLEARAVVAKAAIEALTMGVEK